MKGCPKTLCKLKQKNVKFNIQMTTDACILKYGLHEISFTVYI